MLIIVISILCIIWLLNGSRLDKISAWMLWNLLHLLCGNVAGVVRDVDWWLTCFWVAHHNRVCCSWSSLIEATALTTLTTAHQWQNEKNSCPSATSSLYSSTKWIPPIDNILLFFIKDKTRLNIRTSDNVWFNQFSKKNGWKKYKIKKRPLFRKHWKS